MMIRVWMRTAVHQHVTAFGKLFSTLCHEFCQLSHHIGICRAFHRHHGVKASVPQGSQQGDMLPVVLRYGANDPLPFGGATIHPGHGRIAAGFIDKFQAPPFEQCDQLPVVRARLLDPRRVPVCGVERLF
jgi:hypothetical protein